MARKLDRVLLETLRKWASLSTDEFPEEPNPDARFVASADLNEKVCLWQGRIWTLELDCIVNSTNEAMNDSTGVSGSIFNAAGPQLEEECFSLEGCRTGECKSTRGYQLPCNRIIHTVGPRYNTKYRTAAESALHNCYRNCLEIMVDQKQRTIAFPCIYTERKGYPREPAAHIAIRTIRRFLEKFGHNVDCIVFCVDNSSDHDIYARLLRHYFPRSVEEEAGAIAQLPEDIGDAMGAPVNPERDIRVGAFPALVGQDPDAEEDRDVAAIVRPDDDDDEGSSWTQMKHDQDASRAAAGPDPVLEAALLERQYDRYLRRAKTEDLSAVERFNFIYTSGVDSEGRPIVVLIGKNFPAKAIDLEKVIMFLILSLDSVVDRDYTVVYVHSGVQYGNQPPLPWIKKVYQLFQRKYKKNMKKFVILHPSFTIKAMCAFLRPFVSSKVWTKVSYHDRVDELWQTYFDSGKLNLPEWVHQHEQGVAAASQQTWGQWVGGFFGGGGQPQ